MKTSTKIRIDYFAGSLLLFFARIFSAPKQDFGNSTPRHIAVCKLMGMGSIIQSTPLINCLKKSFPSAKIVFISTEKNRELIGKIKLIDEFFPVDDKNLISSIRSLLKTVLKLRKSKVDVFIDLELYSKASKVIGMYSKSKICLGMHNDLAKPERHYTKSILLNNNLPVAQSYLNIAMSLGAQFISTELFEFSSSKEEVEKIKERFKIRDPYIVINPNASDLRIERRWPADKFNQLFPELNAKYPGHTLVLTGSASEQVYVNQFSESSNRNDSLINTAGKLSFTDLNALISGARFVITNDTGPMHLSFAAGIPTVALFGPASPVQFGNHPKSLPVYKSVTCSPCVHTSSVPPCKGDNQCMKLISVDEVISACHVF